MTWYENAQLQTKKLMEAGHATILAIESSCDETAAAVVRDGREVVSSVISSQIALHAQYGGVVPEIASRAHLDAVCPVVQEALERAKMTVSDVDAVAVTYGPGLVGALLVGVCYAKALAFAAGKPLIPVNHIEGHVSANYIAHPDLVPPFLCLVVSGGHSHIIRVEDYGRYTLLGQTMDDAASPSRRGHTGRSSCTRRSSFRSTSRNWQRTPQRKRASIRNPPSGLTFTISSSVC